MANQKTYTLNIDGNAQLTLPALRADAKLLNTEIAKLPAGSDEAKAALLKLAQVKDEMGDLKEQINALNPDARLLGGFIALGQGIAGAFSVATVAAQEFGLSGGDVEEYEKKVVGLLGVLSGLQSLKDALQPQNFAGLKALASGFDFVALRAKFFGTTTRAALTATGIGALLVAVGLLITYWDDLGSASERLRNKFEDTFPRLSRFLDDNARAVRVVVGMLTFGASEAARSGYEAYKRFTALTLAEQQAAHAALVVEQLDFQAKLSRAQLEAQNASALTLLRNQDEFAAQQAVAAQQAFEKEKALQVGRKELSKDEVKRLQDLQLAAAEKAKASVAAEKAYTDALAKETARRSELEELRATNNLGATAAESARLRVALAAAKEREASAKAEADQSIEDALIYEQAKQKRIDLEKQLTAALEAEYQKRRIDVEAIELPKVKLEVAPPDFKAAIPAELPTVPVTVEPILSEVGFEEVLDLVQRGVTEASALVNQIVTDLAAASTAQLTQQIDATGAQIAALQEQQKQVSQELDDSIKRREDFEAQLQGATGARRAAIVKQIEQERVAEAKLRAEKEKATANELAATREKASLEKQRQKAEKTAQEITAATTLVRSTLLAVESALAIATAVKQNKFGYDAVFLAVSTAAALAASIAQVRAAARLADGGIIDGPSHAQGGVRGTGRFANIEVEGKEWVINTDSSQNNHDYLAYINANGRNRRISVAELAANLPQYVASGQSQTHYAAGGQLPATNTTAATGSTVVTQSPDVVAALNVVNARLIGIESAVRGLRLQIGEPEAEQINALITTVTTATTAVSI